VAGTLEFKSNGKAIAIGFTDQQLSPHAGSAVFWGWLRPLDWCSRLAAALPHVRPTSNNKLLPLEKALAFMHGLLCDARKLTHVAYLRRDPLVPELLGITRVASQSVLTRFFQSFTSAGANLRCFRPLWYWGLDRLPSQKDGYTLDLDSTRLLHKDGHQEGVRGGYTKQGIKPCLHPLLAVLAEVRLVAQLWLRPGNANCGNNVTAFFLDLWENLPRHIRLRGVRADAGFCLPELLALWEHLKLPYVVVAQLSQPVQKIIKGDLKWTATEVPGTEVAELEYQALSLIVDMAGGLSMGKSSWSPISSSKF
jgi:Transposase DDE domain group 1